MTTVLDPGQPTPLWSQLAEALRARVSSGDYTVRFPTEAELTAEFKVSRATVREAIRRLRDEGLLDARRGSGTFVVRRQLDQPMLGTASLARAIEAAGLEESSRVLSVAEGPPGPEAAQTLDIDLDSVVVFVDRLREAAGSPLAIERSTVALEPPARGALLAAEPLLAHGSLYELLAERCGTVVTGGREQARAATCSPDDRRLLQLGRQEGVLEVDRIGYAGLRPVEWRRSLLRGSAYVLDAHWGNGTLG